MKNINNQIYITKNIISFLLMIFLITSIPIKGSEEKSYIINTDRKQDKENKTKKVITVGFGIDIDAAVQDAAVNALKQVSGSFIDEETSYENKYKLQNSLTNQSEILEEKLRSYSQGSIKSYEIISANKKGSLYEVKASFEISTKGFKTYVKERGSGSKKIKKGLFTSILSENKESGSKISFYKKIVSPINRAEVIEVNVGEPITLKTFISPSKKEEETVIAKGFGNSIDNAIKNAAFNALTKVVGSFMDAESYFKYKEEVTNAIVKQSESFSYSVDEYSKGSIIFFEILNTNEENNIYKITAKVTIGLDDFKSYINETLVFGSNVESYSDSICMKTFGYNEVCNKDFSFFTEKQLIPDKTILIPFEISLTDGYLENTEKILSKISSETVTIDPSPFSSYDFLDFDAKEDHIISIIDVSGIKPSVRKYILKGAKTNLYKLRDDQSNRKSKEEVLLYGISCMNKDKNSEKNNSIEIRFLNVYGNTIKKIKPSCLNASKKGSYKIFENPMKDLHNIEVSEIPLISLYTRTNECLANTNTKRFSLCETQIITKRSFWLAVQIEDFDILNEIAEIEITYKD